MTRSTPAYALKSNVRASASWTSDGLKLALRLSQAWALISRSPACLKPASSTPFARPPHPAKSSNVVTAIHLSVEVVRHTFSDAGNRHAANRHSIRPRTSRVEDIPCRPVPIHSVLPGIVVPETIDNTIPQRGIKGNKHGFNCRGHGLSLSIQNHEATAEVPQSKIAGTEDGTRMLDETIIQLSARVSGAKTSCLTRASGNRASDVDGDIDLETIQFSPVDGINPLPCRTVDGIDAATVKRERGRKLRNRRLVEELHGVLDHLHEGIASIDMIFTIERLES